MSDQRFDDVMRMRDKLEKGIVAAISADLATYTRLNSVAFKLDRARFEAAVTIGSPLGHKKILTATDRRYDMFNFTLAFYVTSNAAGAKTKQADESDADFAARQEQQNSFHPQLVAHVDAYLGGLALESKDDLVNFPEHTILLLAGTGHEPDLKPTEGTEQTKMNFRGQFGIRPDAWPAAA